MLITKNDFSPLVKFTANIKDSDINPFILKAERSLPVISENYNIFSGSGLAADLYPLYDGSVTEIEKYREYNGVIWQALAETETAPAEDNELWQAMPLHTVLNLAIKPYLVYKAYDYFLVLHGLDITQAGLTQQTGDGFTAISDSRRKEIIASNRTDLHHAEMRLNDYLRDYDYLPKPEPCTGNTARRGRFGFSVAKNKYR